ncbi:MAG TPA: hypothetical protein VNI01_10495 [Elusimicrobiota bacterium]|nr:hypothetical protein [Elusimicrobiota bacterium]
MLFGRLYWSKMPGLRPALSLWLFALVALVAWAAGWQAGRRARAPGAYTPEAVHPASLPAGGLGG